MTLDSRISSAVIIAALAAAACNTTKGNNGGYSDLSPSTVAPTPGPQPNFTTQAVSLDNAPPPISGGTLTIAPDGHTVVASDPDRDRIYVVDLPSRTVKFDLPLAAGAEPGRVAIDSHNKAHIALRGTGQLVSLDLGTGLKTERPVCVAPRGVVFDAKADSVHVACSEGVLATIPLNGEPMKTLGLDQDIRDVAIVKDKLFVSHFRSAKVDIIDRAGTVIGVSSTQGGNLGWRMAKGPDGDESDDVALVSQDPQNPAPTPGGIGYYGSGALDECNSPTITTTRLDIPGQTPVLIPPAVLPVDLATNGKGEYAIVAAGNGHTKELPQLFIHNVKTRDANPDYSSSSGYYSSSGFSTSPYGTNPDCLALGRGYVPGQAIAAAYDGDDQLIVQSREPAALYIMSPDRTHVFKEIPLSNVTREDSGHAIFHSNSGGFLACASCHAEGGEDGRTWEFVEGQRRTPSMRGTLVNTAPYHWDGQMKDIRALVDHVFSTRMSGPRVDDGHVNTLQNWLFKLPPPPKLQKPADSVARGKVLFESQGCTTCHSGAELTNNTTLDVGNGGSFQVPSLVGVTWRAPYLHNGCAKTLKNRFDGSCGTGDLHGKVSGLSKPEIDDLTTYLESL
jgi:mono/diheme cytochrome c family protein